MSLANLNNVDIVLTPDKSKWSRCEIVETATPQYYDPDFNGTYNTIGGSKNFHLRASPSVGKEDANGDGLPDPDGDGIGMARDPGHEVDVDTGQRPTRSLDEN